MNIVIGSGPAGATVARTLLEQGEAVTLLDVGGTLPDSPQSTLRSLRRKSRSDWPIEDIRKISEHAKSSRRGMELKTVYGSDFAYRVLNEVKSIAPSVLIRASYAKGGLSNVWGGAVLPFHSGDLSSWPFPLKTLEPHYQRVVSWLPYAAVDDSLSNLFPLYGTPNGALPVSRQAAAMLETVDRNRADLNAGGIYAGRSRLAVRANAGDAGPGCVACGLCLTGCPYELIFNSAEWIRAMEGQIRFVYRSGFLAKSIVETADGVEIRGEDLLQGQPASVKGRRVFLAGGFLSTAGLLVASQRNSPAQISAKASQYFLLPFLLKKSVPAVRGEDLHALSQLFITLRHSGVSERFVNLQGYTYNSFFAEYVDRRAGILKPVLKPLIDRLLGRLIVFQGYLHSDDSPSISAVVSSESGGIRFELSRVANTRTRRVLRSAVRVLRSHEKRLGGRFLPWMLAPGKIGDGSHVGGAFPMSAHPGPGESDLQGRPTGFRRVHIADATAFPSIPATTITLSVMANARRIAVESLQGGVR